jgi:hypothetical protein
MRGNINIGYAVLGQNSPACRKQVDFFIISDLIQSRQQCIEGF